MPSVQHSRELQKLNRLTNTQLKALAEMHADDPKFLCAIFEILKPRTRPTADLARHRVRTLLDQDEATLHAADGWFEVWFKTHTKLGLALAGLLAAGVGQAAGGQIWNVIWSWLKLTVLGQAD